MTMKRSLTREWIEAHKGYPHDWCLIWPFARDGRVGRGSMNGRGARRSEWAHRVMCEMVHGDAPPDRPQAAHTCGNGHKGCVNPRHLVWKNNSENQRDRAKHGRFQPQWKKRFTPSMIEELRSLRPQMTQMELAERFECSLGTVQYYLKYRDQRLKGRSVSLPNGERREGENAVD
jgi:hypothetical protein